jgi:hypothetical protein
LTSFTINGFVSYGREDFANRVYWQQVPSATNLAVHLSEFSECLIWISVILADVSSLTHVVEHVSVPGKAREDTFVGFP